MIEARESSGTEAIGTRPRIEACHVFSIGFRCGREFRDWHCARQSRESGSVYLHESQRGVEDEEGQGPPDHADSPQDGGAGRAPLGRGTSVKGVGRGGEAQGRAGLVLVEELHLFCASKQGEIDR